MGRTWRRMVAATLFVAGSAVVAAPAALADTDLTPALTTAINDFRAGQGVGPLPAYETDAEARRVHADFVATLEPHRLFDESAAYYFERGATGFAETQAFVQDACGADELLARWLASPPHRQRLLTPDATHLVVASNCTATGSYGTAQIVTIPAAPAEEPPPPDEPSRDGDGDDTTGGTSDTAIATADPATTSSGGEAAGGAVEPTPTAEPDPEPEPVDPAQPAAGEDAVRAPSDADGEASDGISPVASPERLPGDAVERVDGALREARDTAAVAGSSEHDTAEPAAVGFTPAAANLPVSAVAVDPPRAGSRWPIGVYVALAGLGLSSMVVPVLRSRRQAGG